MKKGESGLSVSYSYELFFGTLFLHPMDGIIMLLGYCLTCGITKRTQVVDYSKVHGIQDVWSCA
jgi:hypothetical protein